MIRDRILGESRNTFYSGAGSGTDSTIRFRNRLEFLVALNKEKLSEDDATYLLADWEWFVPLSDPTTDQGFKTSDNIIDLRLKRVF